MQFPVHIHVHIICVEIKFLPLEVIITQDFQTVLDALLIDQWSNSNYDIVMMSCDISSIGTKALM